MLQGKFTTNKGYSTTTDEAAHTIKKSMEMAVSILTQASQNNPQETNAMNDNKYTNNPQQQPRYTHIDRYGEVSHRSSYVNTRNTSPNIDNNNQIQPLTSTMEAQLQASITNAAGLLTLSKTMHNSSNVYNNVFTGASSSEKSPLFTGIHVQENQQHESTISPIPQRNQLLYENNCSEDNRNINNLNKNSMSFSSSITLPSSLSPSSMPSNSVLNASADFHYFDNKGSDQISQLYEECEKLLKLNAELQTEQELFDKSFTSYIEKDTMNT
mgnify:CR=1 FL=1|jgi:hypothetical protein